MSTFDLLFPSKDIVEKYETVFSENVSQNDSISRTEATVREAWNEIVETARSLRDGQSGQ